MKTIVVSLLVFVSLATNAQSFGIRTGYSLTPAEYVSIRYEHWANSLINLSITTFMERNKFNRLNYFCYGADLLAEYSRFRDVSAMPFFSWRGGLGATWQIECEPWLYKDLSFSKRMNYGFACEGVAECNLTEYFRLSLFAQQKLLFRKQLGSTRFCFGLGLTYNLPSW